MSVSVDTRDVAAKIYSEANGNYIVVTKDDIPKLIDMLENILLKDCPAIKMTEAKEIYAKKIPRKLWIHLAAISDPENKELLYGTNIEHETWLLSDVYKEMK